MDLDYFAQYDLVLSNDAGHNGRTQGDSYGDIDDEPTYSKYGGYNGYDDNTIDSAFEGMPEATWNVD